MSPIDKLKNLDFSNTCIHCPTQEEANQIGALIKQLGGNHRYNLGHNWNSYKEDFVLYLRVVSTYGNIDNAVGNDRTIIPASDILSPKTHEYEPY